MQMADGWSQPCFFGTTIMDFILEGRLFVEFLWLARVRVHNSHEFSNTPKSTKLRMEDQIATGEKAPYQVVWFLSPATFDGEVIHTSAKVPQVVYLLCQAQPSPAQAAKHGMCLWQKVHLSFHRWIDSTYVEDYLRAKSEAKRNERSAQPSCNSRATLLLLKLPDYP